MIDTKYLVISMENHCVFTMSNDPVTANGVASSNFNSFVRAVTRYNFKDFDNIHNRDYFKDNIYKLELMSQSLQLVDPTVISNTWKDDRKKLWLRHDAITLLDMHYIAAIAPIDRYHWSTFTIEAQMQINNCNPSENRYTASLKEYARALDMPVEYAYKELKLKVEGDQILRFRIAALTEKFKQIIASISTLEDLIEVKQQMTKEFWSNSQL